MSLAQRQALVTKLQDIKTRGTKEGDPDIVFLRQVIARIDEELLRREKGLSLADSMKEERSENGNENH